MTLCQACSHDSVSTIALPHCDSGNYDAAAVHASKTELLTIVNQITRIPGLVECMASDYAESHSRKLGHTNGH